MGILYLYTRSRSRSPPMTQDCKNRGPWSAWCCCWTVDAWEDARLVRHPQIRNTHDTAPHIAPHSGHFKAQGLTASDSSVCRTVQQQANEHMSQDTQG